MAQFCYLSLYFSAETVSCKDGRGLKHEKIGSIFSSSNAMPAKSPKIYYMMICAQMIKFNPGLTQTPSKLFSF